MHSTCQWCDTVNFVHREHNTRRYITKCKRICVRHVTYAFCQIYTICCCRQSMDLSNYISRFGSLSHFIVLISFDNDDHFFCPLVGARACESARTHGNECTRFQTAFARRSYLFEKQFRQITPYIFVQIAKFIEHSDTHTHTQASLHERTLSYRKPTSERANEQERVYSAKQHDCICKRKLFPKHVCN